MTAVEEMAAEWVGGATAAVERRVGRMGEGHQEVAATEAEMEVVKEGVGWAAGWAAVALVEVATEAGEMEEETGAETATRVGTSSCQTLRMPSRCFQRRAGETVQRLSAMDSLSGVVSGER